MQIHDFHSKLTSVTEEGGLFQALRTLSRVEDPKHVLNAAEDSALGEWAAWPAMEPSAVASLAAV